MVQAGIVLSYLVYISIIAFIVLKYMQKTKQLKKMNEDFIMAIHDIKNYSVNIDVSSQLLKTISEGEPSSSSFRIFSRHLDVITNNSRRMNELIQSLANTVKLGKANAGYEAEEDVYCLIEEAVKMCMFYAQKKNIVIDIEERGAHKVLHIDKEKLIRILCNLIMNGVKYSYEGGKVLILFYEKNDWLDISIIDKGKGMSRNELDRVFHKHYRGSDNEEKDEFSFGVGLYASRKLAKEMSGELCADSIKGQGSTFTLKLPMKKKGKNKLRNILSSLRIPTKKASL